jgi:glutathione S-transferase
MQLYFSPGACSLAPHIVAREAGLPVTITKVDLKSHTLEDGSDYYKVNPRGYVPLLVLDDGTRMTEANVLVQYLADRKPEAGLMPAAGTPARYKTQEWLAFVATELHKNIGWLFSKDAAESTKAAVTEKAKTRLAELDRQLAGRPYLTGDTFTAADAYAFTIVNWCNFVGIDLKPYPNLSAFMARVSARPKVREALVAEGLAKAEGAAA